MNEVSPSHDAPPPINRGGQEGFPALSAFIVSSIDEEP
jgi:hypothetical protein